MKSVQNGSRFNYYIHTFIVSEYWAWKHVKQAAGHLNYRLFDLCARLSLVVHSLPRVWRYHACQKCDNKTTTIEPLNEDNKQTRRKKKVYKVADYWFLF